MNIYGEDLDFLDALDNQYQSETDDDTSPISKVATVLGDNSVDEEYTKELEEENRANAELNQEIEKEYQEEQEEQEDNDLEDDILSLFDENTNWNSDNLDDDLSEIVPFNTGWNVKNRNVNFEKVNNQFKSILEPIAGGLLFTSTTGDSHTKNSLHPYGRAVDVRANEQSRRIFENPEVLRYLNSNGVKVVFEKAGANSKTTAPHWHLEYRQNGGEIETIIAQTGRFNRFSSNPFSVMSYGSSIPEVGLNTQNYKRNLVANNLSDYYPQQNIGVGIQNGYNPNRDFVDNVMNSSRDPQDITTNPVGLVDDPDEIYIDPGTAVAPIVEDTPTVERNPYQSFQDKVLSDPFTNGQAISSSNTDFSSNSISPSNTSSSDRVFRGLTLRRPFWMGKTVGPVQTEFNNQFYQQSVNTPLLDPEIGASKIRSYTNSLINRLNLNNATSAAIAGDIYNKSVDRLSNYYNDVTMKNQQIMANNNQRNASTLYNNQVSNNTRDLGYYDRYLASVANRDLAIDTNLNSSLQSLDMMRTRQDQIAALEARGAVNKSSFLDKLMGRTKLDLQEFYKNQMSDYNSLIG